MIRNRIPFYMALCAIFIGAVRRYSDAIEQALGAPGAIEGVLPSTGFWVIVSAVCIAASLIPLNFFGSGTSAAALSRRHLVKETIPQIARRLENYCQQSRPDIPLIVDYIIFQARANAASDIHFDPTKEGFVVRFRLDGMMGDVASIPARLTQAIANRFKVLSNLVVYEGFLPQDGRLGSDKSPHRAADPSKGGDFRIAFMPTLHGERIVIRILGGAGEAYNFSELGMEDHHQKLVDRFISEPQGMVILTGPTGSGKTTTIYAALRAIQEQTGAVRSISTLEDPIEYEIPGINQSQVNEKKSFTFEKGLRALLRQDPDVIMVGEIRDSETAGIAIQAGMTGHLIITTVHANSTAATFSRLLEMGVAPYALNTAVTAVIAQRLVRRICLGCRAERSLMPNEAAALGIDLDGGGAMIVFEGRGCAGCDGSGYKGRHALFEILAVTETIRTLVGKGASADEIYARARKEGMTNLLDSSIVALKKGITTPDEVLRVIASDRR
ncbi:MAG: GspE/PulE family protein [Myxococcota bacterium]|nr:GspE/PulE family protein [Myxococcota bacterium]